jgi:hypothetical protein
MKPRVFRTMPAFVFGWIWMAFAAANMVDLIVRGRDLAAAIAAAALLLGSGVAYVVGLRPRVVAAADGIRVHNPLYDIRVPWPAIDKIETTDALEIYSGERSFRAWALQAPPRARARAEARARRGRDGAPVPAHVHDYVKGRLPADFAAEQLTEMAGERHAADKDGATAQMSVSLPAVAALVLPAVLLASSILVAALT